MGNRNYCVYIHKFPNNKMYIGISKEEDINRRWQNGLGYKNQVVYRAIKKYGWENIKHIILYRNFTEEKAKFKERLLIKLFNTNIYCKNSNGYNCTYGGDGANGHKLNEEQKQRISFMKRRENLSEETLKKMSDARKKIEPWNKGKIMTEEWKALHISDKRYSFVKGGDNPRKRQVICENIIYDSITSCWENYEKEVKYETLKKYLRVGRMPQIWKDRGLSYYNK